VSGRGYRILEDGGIEVEQDVLARDAQYAMAGYLTMRRLSRPHVTLKLALSKDGMIGHRNAGQVAITGPVSNAASHVLRATSDVIIIGIGTALKDDPALTCRLPGMEDRTPVRLVLDRHLQLPLDSNLVRTAGEHPVIVATTCQPDHQRYGPLAEAGCSMLACDDYENGIALPELLEDLGGRGYSSIMVEGGAAVAASFLQAGLVDRIRLYVGTDAIGDDGIPAPITLDSMPGEFGLIDTQTFGTDTRYEFERTS
jgi:diaminohydroxyphosphoribosylaminopyrimidine deaminase/5-amino-6-(5-phosphoribosylamino)uracil reductase